LHHDYHVTFYNAVDLSGLVGTGWNALAGWCWRSGAVETNTSICIMDCFKLLSSIIEKDGEKFGEILFKNTLEKKHT